MPTIKEVACCLEPLVLAQLRKRGVKSPRYSIAGFAFSTSPTSECEEVRADERTRTAYPCSSYECAVRRCRSSPGVAMPAFLSGLLCSGLPRVAPYCVPGGVRVVSEFVDSR